jgi:hypothetical protein
MKREHCVALVKMVCEHAASMGAEQHRLLMQQLGTLNLGLDG